ncbi:SRPBCC family protein [Hyalangium rubrum]|uniref:SRPBCC family protein n=1 Tax=Hyalangium rubrum TaxID=3103134 RepID=A0ABU5GVW2_9BACT|nr:SRPBCC family protein [Hyalangium sp. s54d21]MDY7225319.1 SRPBCC family protein [Hyalangium sp. s54d21]
MHARRGEEVSTFKEVEPGRFTFFQRATLGAPISETWPTLRDFPQIAKILIPAGVFQWVEGHSLPKLPARYQLTLGDLTLQEEITACDEREHAVRYHLRSPGLGMQTYSAEIKFTPEGEKQTVVEYSREITLQAGASVEPLKQIIDQQLVALKTHFSRHA